MPSCRNCGARLSKFDNDICPVCGTPNPLEGVNSETIEITSQVDLSDFKAGQKVVRRRKLMLILFFLLGWTGAGYFYLKMKRNAFIWLAVNILLLSSGFLLLHLFAGLSIALSLIIPIASVYALNIIFGLIYFVKKDFKDGEGEFVV